MFSDDKYLGVVTHCGVQVCSDDKCLELLHIVGCKCVQMTSCWVCYIVGCTCVQMTSVWGLLNIVGCKCVQITSVCFCYIWGASVFR